MTPSSFVADPAEYETLTAICREGVLLVTLNRPRSLNALTLLSYRELEHVFTGAAAADSCRSVVIAGAARPDGRACFCAGADLAERSLEDGPRYARRAFGAIEALDKPVIGAIGGVAMGGGVELALVCDIRIVAEGAQLALPEINLGSLPRAGGTQRLPRLVGVAHATAMLFTGKQIDGREAGRLGMATEVVRDGEELPRALALAGTLALKAPLALAAIKRTIRASRELPLEAGLDAEIAEGELLDKTWDRQEGRRAFMEKRPPRFRGS